MARYHFTKKGNKIVLLNPAEKGQRYARQLKCGYIAETGEIIDEKGRYWRLGYLTSRSDNAKAYKSLHPGKVERPKRNKNWHVGINKKKNKKQRSN